MAQDTLFKPECKNGQPLMVVRSALQKAIRFGHEWYAGYFAAELYDSGYANYLMGTLACIATEDCAGDKETLAVVMPTINHLKFMYKEKKTKFEMRPALGMIVIMLCRARKSRMGDNFWAMLEERRRAGWNPGMPTWAYDEHNAEGKQMGRGYRFWCRITAKLFNKAQPEEIGGTDYEKLADWFWMQGKNGDTREPDYAPIDWSDTEKVQEFPYDREAVQREFDPDGSFARDYPELVVR